MTTTLKKAFTAVTRGRQTHRPEGKSPNGRNGAASFLVTLVCAVIGSTGPLYAGSCLDEGVGYARSYALGLGSYGNSGCFVGSTNADRILDPLQVNQDAVFGLNDWEMLGRVDRFGQTEIATTAIDTFSFSGLTTNAGLVGEFAVSASIFDAYSGYALVVKGAKASSGLNRYVSFLFSEFDGTNGFIHTPFLNEADGSFRRFTHVSLYATKSTIEGLSDGSGPSPVPLPASSWVLVSALGMTWALKCARRRA